MAKAHRTKYILGLLLTLLCVCGLVELLVMTQPAIGDTPFATEVVSSNGPFGSSPYDDPNSLLGKPSTNFGHRVKLVEPAYGTGYPGGEKLITTLNSGSQITVKFDHHVMDDPNNPYGIDLLVFGNSFFGGGGYVDDTTDMNTYTLTGGCFAEPTKVSVSQDGVSWYRYDGGPYGDSKFPTQAYVWDRENAQWTDVEMDWTKPVDPSIGGAPFAADMIDLYDGSAGGTGFDLAESGYSWIQYVKVEGLSGFSGGEIDAFADVAPAGEIISFTVTDQGAPGINFGSLDPGVTDSPEAAQTGTDGAVKLTVSAETNVNCDIQTRGSGPFSYLTNNIAINNAKWDKDNGVGGATALTTTYATIDSSTAGTAKTVDVWHWIGIPGGQIAGDYQTTFYYQAIAQ